MLRAVNRSITRRIASQAGRLLLILSLAFPPAGWAGTQAVQGMAARGHDHAHSVTPAADGAGRANQDCCTPDGSGACCPDETESCGTACAASCGARVPAGVTALNPQTAALPAADPQRARAVRGALPPLLPPDLRPPISC